MQQVIINLKVSKEGYMRKFVGQKGMREMMKLCYNLQNKKMIIFSHANNKQSTLYRIHSVSETLNIVSYLCYYYTILPQQG